MAAAMLLTTAFAADVNATTFYRNVPAAGIVNFRDLYLAQTQATQSGNLATYYLTDNDTVGSYSNPIDVGITDTSDTLNGHIRSIDTDLHLFGDAITFGGNIVYFDAATGNVVATAGIAADSTINFANDATKDSDGNLEMTVATIAAAYPSEKITPTYGSDGVSVTGGTFNREIRPLLTIKDAYPSENITISKSGSAVTGGTIGSTQYNSAEAFGGAIIQLLYNHGVFSDTITTSDLNSALSSNNDISSSVMKETVNGAYKADVYIGGDVFNRFAIDNDGSFRFNVNTPSLANDTHIQNAIHGNAPIVMSVTLRFAARARVRGNVVGAKRVWIRLANTAESNYDGYVILKQDNGQNLHIGVNYTQDSNGYATLTAAESEAIKRDSVKGGRLLLDYVYDRTNTTESTTANTAFRIRTISSRIFKDGKFQAVSGLGDDGAKWIRHIHNGAFRKCKQLKKVNLDTSRKIRKINEKAFYDCKKLATVKLDGRSLKKIGTNAFKGTKSNIKFKIKANTKTQYNKAVKMIKKAAPKKAKFYKI